MSVCTGDSGPELTDRVDGFLRRWAKRGGKNPTIVVDQLTNRRRATAVAFEPRLPGPTRPSGIIDEALSGNLESLLLAAGLPLSWRANLSKDFVARVSVGTCQDCGLRVFHDPNEHPEAPEKHNPYHAVICDLVEMAQTDNDRYQQVITDLAKASTIAAE